MSEIVLDIDGVLANFEKAACDYFGPCDRTLYSLTARWPTRAADVAAFCNDPETYANLSMVRNAADGVMRLACLGHKISYCTARPNVNGMIDVTRDWLAVNCFETGPLWLVPYKEKAGFCRKLSPFAVIDDAPDHIKAMHELGINVVVFEQPWNSYSLGPRLFGW